MSQYYNLRTKATILDVTLSNDLNVSFTDREDHCYISDNYDNSLSCLYDNDGRIIRLIRYGANDPTYICYKMIVDYDSLILSETLVHDPFQDAIKMPDDRYYANPGYSWEEYTCSILEFLSDDESLDRYDYEKVRRRFVDIQNQIKHKIPTRLPWKEDIEDYDQDYYVFCSNTTVFELARDTGILIEKDHMDYNVYWIKDRYESVIECHVQDGGIIDYIIPHVESAWYVLYTLAIDHSALFIDNEVHEKVLHYAEKKGVNENGIPIYDVESVYKQYVYSFTNVMKDKGLEQEFTST